MDIKIVSTASIVIPDRARKTNKRKVNELADSILEVGLLQPIGLKVSENPREYDLIYGRHRLAAFESLERFKIPAVILTLDEVKIEIATIDENIKRSELTAAQFAKALSRRKKLYESLHPETKKGAAGGHAKHGSASDKMSFAGDTASKTGKSRRTIERDTALGNDLDERAVEILDNHKVANSKSELKKLSEKSPAQQRKIASQLKAGKIMKVEGVADVRRLKKVKKPLEATRKDLLTKIQLELELEANRFILLGGHIGMLVKLLRKIADDLEKKHKSKRRIKDKK